MSHCIVSFLVDKTCEIVPKSAISGPFLVSSSVGVLWTDGKKWKAKIVYIGTEAECKDSIAYVTKSGNLSNLFFSVSAPSSSTQKELDTDDATEEKSTKEIIAELKSEVSELRKCVRDLLNRQAYSNDRQDELLEQVDHLTMTTERNSTILRSIQKNAPNLPEKETLTYLFCAEDIVKSLRTSYSDPRTFGNRLEKIVFESDPEKHLPVDSRIASLEKVQFVRKATMTYFNIAMEQQHGTWNAVKAAINNRLRLERYRSKPYSPATPRTRRACHTPTTPTSSLSNFSPI